MGYAFFQIILIILFVTFSSSFLTSISAAEKVHARDTRICDPCCVSVSLEGCGGGTTESKKFRKLHKPRARFLKLDYRHSGCTTLGCRSAHDRMTSSIPVPTR